MTPSTQTIREALTVQALEEIDVLVTKLDKSKDELQHLCELIPGYYEETSNEIADIIKRGVVADIDNANKRLAAVHKELSNNIETQRKVTATLNHLIKKQSDSNTSIQTLYIIATSFAGSCFGVLLSNLVFS